jgi:hypothetical protein
VDVGDVIMWFRVVILNKFVWNDHVLYTVSSRYTVDIGIGVGSKVGSRHTQLLGLSEARKS